MSTIAASNDQLLQEIREANLAYLVLAQHMIRADKAQALYRLGVSEEVATIIDQLKPRAIDEDCGVESVDPAISIRRRYGLEPFDEPLEAEVQRDRSRRRWLACQHRDGGQLANVTA
jgi:hypothetical protein